MAYRYGAQQRSLTLISAKGHKMKPYDVLHKHRSTSRDLCIDTFEETMISMTANQYSRWFHSLPKVEAIQLLDDSVIT